jgi:hypothetical protein
VGPKAGLGVMKKREIFVCNWTPADYPVARRYTGRAGPVIPLQIVQWI